MSTQPTSANGPEAPDACLLVASTLSAAISPPVNFISGRALTGMIGPHLLDRYFERGQKTAEGQVRRAVGSLDPTVLEERGTRATCIGWDVQKFEALVAQGYGFSFLDRGVVVEMMTTLAGRILRLLTIYPDGRVTDTGFTHDVPGFYTGPLPADYRAPEAVPEPAPAIEYQYTRAAIVAEVPRHGEGNSEPFRWNENRVCINPDLVYQAQQSKKDDLKLLTARRPDGEWSAGFDFNYSKGPGGSSSPVSLSGPGFATKEEAIRAEAAALLVRPGAVQNLHKNLLAGLAIMASPAPASTPPFDYATDAQHLADVRFEQDGGGREGWASTDPGKTKYHHYDAAGKSQCSYQRQQGPLHFADKLGQLQPKQCCSACDLALHKQHKPEGPRLKKPKAPAASSVTQLSLF